MKKDIIIIMVFIVKLTLTRSHNWAQRYAIPLVEGSGTFGIVKEKSIRRTIEEGEMLVEWVNHPSSIDRVEQSYLLRK